MARGRVEASNAVLDTVLEDDPSTKPGYGTTDPVEGMMPAEGMSIRFTKAQSKFIQRNIEQGKTSYEIIHAKWDRIFEEYQKSGNEGNLNLEEDYNLHFDSDADENIIRNNIKTMMRTTYMQNPHVEFTDVTSESKLGECLEYVLDFLMNKKTWPGMNMRAKIRRWIAHGQMTNFGIIRLDYQPMDGSRQEAVNAIQAIEKKLAKTKKKSEIEDLYAQLEVVHEKLPSLINKGMAVSNVLPNRIIVSKGCTMIDFTDSDFVAEEIDYDRSYIMNKYYIHDEEEGCYYLRANKKITTGRTPTNDSDDGTTGAVTKQSIVDTVLNSSPKEIRDLNLKDTIRCYMYYDKPLRRHYLFSSEQWEHPLYAWEDDMGLSRYFRHFAIAFGEPIESVIQPGEVSFYIGQVNEINRINREAKRIRDAAFNTIVYNKQAVDGKEVAKLVRHLRNPKQVASFGVSTDPDKKIAEVLEMLVPPPAQAKELYDTTALRSAVDRAANQSEIDRGQQFKTNTTNQQVQYYAQNKQQTSGVLVDTVEEALEDVTWSMTEILISKYTSEDITALVGEKKAADFVQMSVDEFNQSYRMQIAPGSIEKPTSEFKKQEALAIAQALGQVGQAAPGTTMTLMVRMLKTAFSGLVVKDEDWEMLTQEIQANLTKGVSTDGTGTGSPQKPAPAVNGA
jgi:hypothetical protein